MSTLIRLQRKNQVTLSSSKRSLSSIVLSRVILPVPLTNFTPPWLLIMRRHNLSYGHFHRKMERGVLTTHQRWILRQQIQDLVHLSPCKLLPHFLLPVSQDRHQIFDNRCQRWAQGYREKIQWGFLPKTVHNDQRICATGLKVLERQRRFVGELPRVSEVALVGICWLSSTVHYIMKWSVVVITTESILEAYIFCETSAPFFFFSYWASIACCSCFTSLA